jgi:signal transduction histidine kinase
MLVAELPVDEELRLLDLASYKVLDTEPEADFDELVALAAHICRCPIALITLLDKDRQWFKAKKGMQEIETARSISFCSHVTIADKVLQVKDASIDTRFADNPLVTGETNIRFYAGAPIVSPNGHILGAICVMDNIPRELTKEEETSLLFLAKQAMILLGLRKRNLLLRQSAEELLIVKNKIINKVMEIGEDDKKEIASNLHEDLAQDVAGSMLYLKMAEQDNKKRLPLVHKAVKQLQSILNKIRKLSNAIIPSTIQWIGMEDLLQEFTGNIAHTLPFDLRFTVLGKRSTIHSDKALVIVRIIEHWMKVLAINKKISRVNLILKTDKQIELQIEDDGPLINFNDQKRLIFDSLIYDMAHLQGGAVDLSVSATGKNVVKVILPINGHSDLS